MRLSNKATVVTTGVAMLMTLGVSSAMASREPDHKATTHGCYSDSSSENTTGRQTGLVNIGNVSLDNLGSNGLCQANLLDGLTLGVLGNASGGSGSDGGAAQGCDSENSSDNETGNQSGLVNLGNVSASNLGSNLLCQSNIANDVTAAVLGTAVGGGEGADPAHGCSADNSAENETGNQSGLVNLGNVSVDNLGSNLLCQSNIANNLTASVLGTAIGGQGSILGGGDGSILSSLLGGFLGGDASILAHLGLLF